MIRRGWVNFGAGHWLALKDFARALAKASPAVKRQNGLRITMMTIAIISRVGTSFKTR